MSETTFRKNSPDTVQEKGDLSRKSYKLIQPLVQAGVEKAIGDMVDLYDQQAERLRKSGHIA